MVNQKVDQPTNGERGLSHGAPPLAEMSLRPIDGSEKAPPFPSDPGTVEAVISALRVLGGLSTIDDIAAQSKRMEHHLTEHVVGECLRAHSADHARGSTRPRGFTDLFYLLVDTKHNQEAWGLRGFLTAAPDEYPISGLRRTFDRLVSRAETLLFNVKGIAYRDEVVHAVQVTFGPSATYPDRLMPDGRIEHIGEGKARSQAPVGGNRGMLQAEQQQRPIPVYLTIGPKGKRSYVELGNYQVVHHRKASLRLDTNDYRTDAFVFTLEPVALREAPMSAAVDTLNLADEIMLSTLLEPGMVEVPVEEQHTESLVITSRAEQRIANRIEASLVKRFVEYAKTFGRTVKSHRISYDRSLTPFRTDAYVVEDHLLIEAKGSIDREAFRMALGQLADYRRSYDRVNRAVLMPGRPHPDILSLACAEGVGVICEDNGHFVWAEPLKPGGSSVLF